MQIRTYANTFADSHTRAAILLEFYSAGETMNPKLFSKNDMKKHHG
jgi:hypothetical protein